MRLYVDGYNVIFAPSAHDFHAESSESAREQLLSLLSAYRHVTTDSITVVFDGHPRGRMYPQTQNLYGITVIFSEADADADAVIKRLIAKETNPQAVTVVTSDNSIRNFAKRFGAKRVGSEEFLRHVDRTLEHAHSSRRDDVPIEKYEGLRKDQVEYWLKIFGADKDEE